MTRPFRSYLFSFLLVVLFFRPLVSGMGMDYFGTRGFLDTFLRLGILFIVLVLALGKFELELIISSTGAAGLWLGWAFISSVAAELSGRSIFVSFQRLDVYISLLAIAVVVASLAQSERERRAVIQTILASGLTAAVYGIWQYFVGFERTVQYISMYGTEATMNTQRAAIALERKRIFSTTFSPDLFAGMMAAIVPLACAYFIEKRKENDKISSVFGLLTLIACMCALYLTGSLGGWLAAGAGFLLLAFMLLGRGRKRIIAVVILITLMLLAGGGIILRRAETFKYLKHPNNPITQRLNYWEGGIKLFASKPLTGVGSAHFGNAYLSIKPENAGATRFAHNAIVQYLSEIGAPGTLGFILIISAFLLKGAKLSKENTLGAGIFASGIAFLAHSMIDYDTEIIEVAGVFWIMFGLAAQGERGKNKGIFRAVVLGLSMALILFTFWSATGAYYMEKAQRSMEAGEFGAASQAIERARWLRGMDPAEAKLEAKVFSMSPRGVIETETALRRLVSIDSMDSSNWMELGNFYQYRGDYADAVGAFEKAAQLYPTFPVVRASASFSRAHVLMQNGDYAGAKRELQKVLADFPNHKGALEGLKYLSQLEKEKSR